MRLKMEGNEVVAEISDDGRGFGSETKPAVGLSSMRERATLIGADLEIQSEPGHGTSVRARVPFPQEPKG